VARDNYSFKKHQRELSKKKKAEEKKQRKLEKKSIGAALEPGQASSNNDAVE